MMKARMGCLFGFACLFAALLALGLPLPHAAQAQSPDTSSTQAALQQQLNQIDAEIDTLKTNLAGEQQKQDTLQGELDVLDDQIQTSQLSIKRRNLTIEQISQNIQSAEDNISGLNDQLQSEYSSLGAILRETDELDQTSPIIAVLASKSLSEFFTDIDEFSAINQDMQQSFTQIQNDTQADQEQKTTLQAQLDQETQLKQVQQLQQQQLQSQEDQKNKLLSATKGQEASYQTLITTKQQTAAQIRATLFALSGTKAIPFEEALQYADLAEKETGIRPAFLLGIITEESDLGENVGTGNWQTDMNPTRDAPVFKAITASLGLDPDSMPVSKKAWYGWGGAMGPAQFIPSTWAGLAGYEPPNYTYDPAKDRIGALTGDKPPNPWNAKDAFMASALLLTDDGAAVQTPAAEFRAAMCYLAGCGNVGDVSLQFYGDQVQCLELKYQKDIDTINGTHEADAMEANSLYYGQC